MLTALILLAVYGRQDNRAMIIASYNVIFMDTTLAVTVYSPFNQAQQPIDFFSSENWTDESEAALVQRLKDLVSILKNAGKSLHLHLKAEVADAVNAAFAINKQKNKYETRDNRLSAREQQVLGLIIRGYTNVEIGKKLFISFETVRTHRKNINAKTEAKNTAALIRYYYETSG